MSTEMEKICLLFFLGIVGTVFSKQSDYVRVCENPEFLFNKPVVCRRFCSFVETPCKDSTHHRQGCTDKEENEYQRKKEETRKLCILELFSDSHGESSNTKTKDKVRPTRVEVLREEVFEPVVRDAHRNRLNETQILTEQVASIFGLSNHDEVLVVVIVAIILSIISQAVVNWHRFSILEKQNRVIQEELSHLRQFLLQGN
eukprot:TRINITY_DN1460_c0_g1_i4.p1 TRINITY_DN1460_c0_g1~~TRINITY_DN1460_c0_g1_i4.p1  ORF type:complete len:201 (+),score=28.90 TRINITY_DN1460_c0_g1_i4:74-676(+)